MPEDIHAPRRTRTVLAGMIGNVLEWYDFALFGFMAPDPRPAVLSDRGSCRISAGNVRRVRDRFLMRPIGGDFLRAYRRPAWSEARTGMVGAADGSIDDSIGITAGSHAQIGLAAPVLLTVIRMLQGFSVGGEFIGSISFLGEHAPPAARRGFFGSWSTSECQLGKPHRLRRRGAGANICTGQ